MGYLAAYAVREMNGYTLIRLNGPNLKRVSSNICTSLGVLISIRSHL